MALNLADMLFPPGYYRNLISLYTTLGVKFRHADFSYSFSSLWPSTTTWEGPFITTTTIYNGGSGRSGVSKPLNFGHGTAVQRPGYTPHPANALGIYCLFLWSTVQLLFCYLITLFHALPFRRPATIHELGFKEWTLQVAPKGYLSRLIGMDTAWEEYVHTVLIPLLSAVCTAPKADVMNHPMEEILGM
jgi:microfibrillar-associated protein 1